MTSSIDRFFSTFGGDALARERAIPGPMVYSAPKGTAHCEGCAKRKPILGISRKGWRCRDCKASKNRAKNC